MKAEFIIKNYRCFNDAHPIKFILEDGFIAIIGPNNVGKSSILKFFHEFRNLWSCLRTNGNVANLLRNTEPSQEIVLLSVHDKAEVFTDLNNRSLMIEIKFFNKQIGNVWPITKLIIEVKRFVKVYENDQIKVKADFYINDGNKFFTELGFADNNKIIVEKLGAISFEEFFNFFSVLERIVYYPSFRNVINTGGGNYYDITVGEGFVNQWHDWSVGTEKIKNNAIQSITEDIQRIFRYKKFQIQSSSELRTLQVTIDTKTYKLSEVGSGIAQFILVFGNAAINRPSFIFIDEPEASLHPSLQLDFLTALASYSQHGIVFATHSLGLARSVADKIYSIRKENDFRIISAFEKTNNLSEFIGELSFSSFNELGFNKVLLVEGISEVKTIQQFLRMMKKDHEIIFLPLGGSQMINGSSDVEHELIELKRITNKVFALIDSEKENKNDSLCKDREEFKELCEKNEIKLHVLEYRAIENYFSLNAIQKVKGEKYNVLEKFEKLKNAEMPWAKSENWRIAREMELSDIEGTDLFDFLEKI